ncbi:hypothetical protein NL676_023067 [Syzygium grande]|nr:hypothetical protein NL676_023067 [Syzygium grande]
MHNCQSLIEVEYRAVAIATAELQWVRNLMSKFGIQPITTPTLYYDNIDATYVYVNPVFHFRIKHIAIDYHFVRDLVARGAFRVSHISTTDQLADALTKPLSKPRLSYLQPKIGIFDGSAVLWGRVKGNGTN